MALLPAAHDDIDPFLAEDTDGTPLDEEPPKADGGSPVPWVLLWPAVICLMLLTLGILTMCYGPTKVLQVILKLFVPPHAHVGHAFAIWGIIFAVIVLGIPVIALLLPIPALTFGFWIGYAMALSVIVLGSLTSFILGRYVAQRQVRGYLAANQFQKSVRFLRVIEDENEALRFMVLFRFLIIPMVVRNYGPSLLEVPLWKFAVSTLPHGFWAGAIHSYAGFTFKASAEYIREGRDSPTGLLEWHRIATLVVGLVAGVTLSVLAYRTYAKRLQGEEDAELGVDSPLEEPRTKEPSLPKFQRGEASGAGDYGATRERSAGV